MYTRIPFLNKFLSLGLMALTLTACEESDTKDTVERQPIVVKVAQTTLAQGGHFNAGSGQVKAENSATLSTRIMGFVERIPVKVGQKVSKGQLLVSITNTDLQAKKAQVDASIIEAKAGLNNAEKDYQRFVNLFKQNSASQKELDDMTAQFDMAKARYEAAQQLMNEVNAQFAYANIRAPFSGVVTNTHIDEGAMANPGMPLVSMEAPGGFEIEAKVAENRIDQLTVGSEALVYVKALKTTVKGRLTELSTSAQFSGGQYIAKVQLQEVPKTLLSGMFATVRFPTEKESKVSSVRIPTTALVKHGQLNGIYTVGPNDTAILRWLRLGETNGDMVEVISGLSVDEAYIVSAEGKLYNGAKLAIQ